MKIGGRLDDDELNDLLRSMPRDESAAPSAGPVACELEHLRLSSAHDPDAAVDRWMQFVASSPPLSIEDFAAVIRVFLKVDGGVVPAAQVVALACDQFPSEASRFAGCRSLIRDAVRRGDVQGDALAALEVLGY